MQDCLSPRLPTAECKWTAPVRFDPVVYQGLEPCLVYLGAGALLPLPPPDGFPVVLGRPPAPVTPPPFPLPPPPFDPPLLIFSLSVDFVWFMPSSHNLCFGISRLILAWDINLAGISG
jgi:hypothetical protein